MKQKICFKIVGGEAFYDIANKTFLTKRSREALSGYSPEMLASMAVNGDDEDLNQIKNSYLSAVANLQVALSEYIYEGSESATKITDKDNSAHLLDEISKYDITFELEFPSNYNTGLIDSISWQAYNYCVNKSCGDWFKITSPNDADNYYTLASTNLDNIRVAINRRKRPNRKSYLSHIQDDDAV